MDNAFGMMMFYRKNVLKNLHEFTENSQKSNCNQKKGKIVFFCITCLTQSSSFESFYDYPTPFCRSYKFLKTIDYL